MATIASLRDSIQGALPSDLRAYDVATGRERLPAAIVFPRPPVNGRFEASTCTYRIDFVVEIHCSLGQGLERAQNELDGFINPTGSSSVQAALEADRTLSAAADTLDVRAFELYGFGTLNDQQTLVARVPVSVWVDQS